MIKSLNLHQILGRISSIIVLGLLMLSTPVNASINTDDWEDSFDNADSLKNWRNPYGNYTVDENEKVLVASNCPLINGFCLSSLWRNSTSTTGTWSFDLQIPDNHTFFIFYFMGISSTADGFHPNTGYAFQIDKFKVFHLRYRYAGLNPIINSYTPTNETNDWMHFDITRNSAGDMEIFLNHLSIITGQDNRFTTSENINFQLDNSAKLDNVSYSQSILKNSANSPGFNSTETLFFFTLVFVLIKLRKKKMG